MLVWIVVTLSFAEAGKVSCFEDQHLLDSYATRVVH